MKQKIYTGARVFMGLIFFVFGLNGLFHFFPTPSSAVEAATFPASYFFPFVKIVQISCGFLLLINRFAPLALIVLTPIIVNILLFHIFVDPKGFPIAAILVTLNIILAISYKKAYSSLLKDKL